MLDDKQKELKGMTKATDTFFSRFPTLQYKKGEVILRAEDPPSGVYYLKSGFVRQYIVNANGDMFVIHIYRPGSFFPLMWAVNNIPNSFYFEAMTQTVVHRAPKDPVIKFLRQHPDILFYTTQRLISGLHGLVSRIEHLVLDTAYMKTALLLLYLAQHFGKPADGGILLRVPVRHREIAAWIGTTRETASLQIEALKRRGILKTRGRQLIIPDLKLLEREAVLSQKESN